MDTNGSSEGVRLAPTEVEANEHEYNFPCTDWAFKVRAQNHQFRNLCIESTLTVTTGVKQ